MADKLGRGLLDGYTGSQSADGVQDAGAPRRPVCLRQRHERQPELDAIGKPNVRWHDANDG